MSNHDPERRVLLRGMLAAGCALCVPIAWAAQTPGEEAKKPGAAKGGKVSKAQAKYQNHPNGEKKCAGCSNFVAPDSCKLVAGKISPNGWCTLWTPKPA